MHERRERRFAIGAIAAVITAALIAQFVAIRSASADAQDSPGTRPQRIVSINLCTDQLLVQLVARRRIAALSRLAADPVVSAVTDQISGIKLVRGSAEEVLSLNPDLVVTSSYSTPHVVNLLRRLGVPVLVVPLANDFDAIREVVRQVAARVGETARGEAVIAEFDRRLAAAAPASPMRPTALAYQVNSLTSGPGGLIDAALGAAGLRNVASERPLGPGGRLPLERLVTQPPDLLVLANAPDAFRTVMADNLRHRAFRDVLSRRRHVTIAMPLWLCGTPAIATAVEKLGSERAQLLHAAIGPVSPSVVAPATQTGHAR